MCYHFYMKNQTSRFQNIIRTASWIWLIYLVILAISDWIIFGFEQNQTFGIYYLLNTIVALIFFICAYASPLQKVLKKTYIPLMIFLIAGLPIIVNRFNNPHLPTGPLSSPENLTLRSLPIFFLGLIIVTWYYDFKAIIFYAFGTVILESSFFIFQVLPEHLAKEPMIFVLLIRTISLIVVGFFIQQLINHLRNQQKELRNANTQLLHYASTIETLTTTRERNRMARELHDTLAHTLSGLSVQLETTSAYWDVEPDTAKKLLDNSLEATRSGLDETRRALKALRASPIEDLGLLLAIKQLLNDAKERGNLSSEINIPDDLPQLSPDVEQSVYRITQETIENIIHHANASTIKIDLVIQEAQITLSIQDDGLGFNIKQPKQPGHYGLSGMQERATVAGGTLIIDSQKGKGTTIKLTLKGI